MSVEEIEAAKSAFIIYDDFPIKGQSFRDIQPVLQCPQHVQTIRKVLFNQWKNKGITKVLVSESMGYFFGSILAADINAGIVMARKAGKLPGPVISLDYFLLHKNKKESLEVERGAINENDVVLIHDDSVYTGGTINAIQEVLKQMNVKNIFMSFVFQIDSGKFEMNERCQTVMHFD
ncbi:Adenine_phosphoribosyltransferase [Hexamita inflata]|uniref:adenine phosphoribosyltransferase n=1 Tax=Hexamita inflata TaxID=28002 RepID=A0AA86P6C7_9EUKA|nr:Adenine phosphoribosyltransferase [Hexamita inflata]